MHEFFATDENALAGALVFWSLTGSVDLAELRAAWLAAGLDPELLPKPPSPARALHRAALALAGKRQLVRPLRTKAWAFVQETLEGEGEDEALQHEELVTLRATDAQILVTALAPEHEGLAERIRADAAAALQQLSVNDASSWLLDLADSVSAVGLRDRGGFYFVPREELDGWREMIAIVHEVSAHKVYEIPAMRTESAAEAVLDGLRKEAAAAMVAFEEYLLRDEEAMTERGLAGVQSRLEALQAKLVKYAALLGDALPDVQSRAEQLLGATVALKMAKASAK